MEWYCFPVDFRKLCAATLLLLLACAFCTLVAPTPVSAQIQETATPTPPPTATAVSVVVLPGEPGPGWTPLDFSKSLLDGAKRELESGMAIWWDTVGPGALYKSFARGVGYLARNTVGSPAAITGSADLLTYAPERTYADPTTSSLSRLVRGLVGGLIGVIVTFTGLSMMWGGLMASSTDVAATLPRAMLAGLVTWESEKFLQWLTDLSNAVTRYLAQATTTTGPGAAAIITATKTYTDAQAAGGAAAEDITTGTLFLVYGAVGIVLRVARSFQEAVWSFLLVTFALVMVAWILERTVTWFARWLTLAAAVLLGGPLQAIPLRQGGERLATGVTSDDPAVVSAALLGGIASLLLAFAIPALVGVSLSGPGMRGMRRAAGAVMRHTPGGAAAAAASSAVSAASGPVSVARDVTRVSGRVSGGYEITRMPLLPVPRPQLALPPPR